MKKSQNLGRVSLYGLEQKEACYEARDAFARLFGLGAAHINERNARKAWRLLADNPYWISANMFHDGEAFARSVTRARHRFGRGSVDYKNAVAAAFIRGVKRVNKSTGSKLVISGY